MNDHKDWLLPTLAGVAVATLRRFRRQKKESIWVTLFRFASHAATCMACGYITWGLLIYFDAPKLVPPLCAISGMCGTIIVDWIEDSGTGLLTEYIRSKTKRPRRSYEPYDPYADKPGQSENQDK